MARNRTPRLIVVLILLLLILAPLFSNGVNLVVDWIWFKSVGYGVLYLTTLKAQIWMSTLAGMGFIMAVGINLLIARALSRRYGFRVYHDAADLPMLDRMAEAFVWVIWVAVLLIGYVIAQWGATHWQVYLLAEHARAVGRADPIFGIDLGFYLFTLSYHWFLYHLALVAVIFSLIGTAFYYLLEGGIWVTARGPSISQTARAHLMVLGGLFFALLAYRARLAMYGLLFSSRGIIYGAGYTDVHASLPVLWLLLALSLLTALLFFAGAATGRARPALLSVLGLVAVALVGGNLYPSLIQHLVVTPNELDKESPFIRNNIEFTRQAYGLDRFEEHEFPAAQELSLADIQDNTPTMRNVRLWDHRPLLTTFGQLQEIRTYYDFARVDNDRYWIDGNYRQVSLSPRELASSSLPDRTWVNEHLIYTHGYGLCLSPVNEFTPDGLPVLTVKDIPPASTTPSIRITRPEIYYGELSNNYCFVKTGQQEFDYPSGNRDVYTTYEGTGGVPVENFWRRLLFALKFGQKNILFSTDIHPASRLMIYRRVLDRVQRLTPFLSYDSDPYMVIRKDGSLDWILDGYTTSDRYPYSDPTAGVGNYIRNSVKVTLNAYNGAVKFYVSDPSDPLIQAYERIYPGVFLPLAAMPEDLLAHIRYPEGFFSIQAAKYAVYHMTDPRVFYNKEDLWRVAQSAARGPASPMPPYYTIMKLAEVGKTEEFILMVPFTPARKNNMIAWMAARCDAPNYGKVLVFAFPKQKLVYGPQQIESRIDQAPAISQLLTLWGQGGSTVIRGTLLVIPVLNSILYVEPLYLAAQAGGALPQLKRVIVAYSDKVVMQPTLDDALTKIFGGNISTSAASPSPSAIVKPVSAVHAPQINALINEANQEFDQAQQLLRQSDWAGYGSEMTKLKATLRKLVELSGKK